MRTVGLKFFTALLLCTSFIISFSFAGTAAYNAVFESEDLYPEGTKIGTVNISGLTKEEAANKVLKTVEDWKLNSRITLQYQKKSEKLATENVQFQIVESLSAAKAGEQNPILALINGEAVNGVLDKLGAEREALDLDQLNSDLRQGIESLEQQEFAFDLSSYLRKSKETGVVSATEVKGIKDMEGLNKLIKQAPFIEINPQDEFSLLEFVKEKNVKVSDETLSIFATALYKTILPTNFEVAERYTSSILPSYAKVGEEARVIQGKMDFSFYNPNLEPYKIELKALKDGLSASMQGLEFLQKYEFKITDVQTFKPKTIVKFQSTPVPGYVNVTEEGKPGTLGKVTRLVKDKQGKVVETSVLTEDFYPPVHRIEIHNLIVRENTETKPGTADVVDPVTGEIINDKPVALVDPVTGKLIDPDTGEVLDPETVINRIIEKMRQNPGQYPPVEQTNPVLPPVGVPEYPSDDAEEETPVNEIPIDNNKDTDYGDYGRDISNMIQQKEAK